MNLNLPVKFMIILPAFYFETNIYRMMIQLHILHMKCGDWHQTDTGHQISLGEREITVVTIQLYLNIVSFIYYYYKQLGLNTKLNTLDHLSSTRCTATESQWLGSLHHKHKPTDLFKHEHGREGLFLFPMFLHSV